MDKEREVGWEVRTIENDQYDVEKRSFIKTNSEAEGCGTRWRRDRSNGCTMILMYEVLSRSNRTRKERLEGKSGLLRMINMMWRRDY